MNRFMTRTIDGEPVHYTGCFLISFVLSIFRNEVVEWWGFEGGDRIIL